jgi:hypothetical protein
MLMGETVLWHVLVHVVNKVLGEGRESEGNANIPAGLESSLNLYKPMEF